MPTQYFQRVCNTLFLSAVLFAGSVYRSDGQSVAGAADPTFQASANAQVDRLLVQPDDKVVLAGLFTSIDGQPHRGLVRLNADGTVDAAFGVNIDNYFVNAMALQPDGKILIAGSFTQVNGTACLSPARLNADGTIDSTFKATGFTSGPNGLTVNQIVVQPDGKILLAELEAVTDENGAVHQGVLRLNADGSLDSSYIVNTAPGDLLYGVSLLALQPDGKLLVGGAFGTVNGTSAPSLVRLNPDGSVDSSFDASGSIHSDPSSGLPPASLVLLGMQPLPDGKVLVSGEFAAQSDPAAPDAACHLIRLQSDGTVDTSFSAAVSSTVAILLVQPDGKFIVSARDSTIDGVMRNGLVRLNADGSLDETFIGGSLPEPSDQNSIAACAAQSDGKLIVGGYFVDYDGAAHDNVVRVDTITVHPPFFTGEVDLGSGVDYLAFASGHYFGYYAYLTDARYLYHFDLGYEYWFDAGDGSGGITFYDFTSGHYFYTSPTFPFPYLYDFNRGSVLYYFPDPQNNGRYNTNGTRYFYDFGTGQIIAL